MSHYTFSWLMPVMFILAQTDSAQQRHEVSSPEELQRSNWFAEVSKELQAGEYRFSQVEGEQNAWSAPNREHGFRTRVSGSGIEVTPRAGEPDVQWVLNLATKSFGRHGQTLELSRATVAVTNERVELDHGPLTEWLVNEDRGLEQGWTIARAPFGVEALWIGLEVAGDLNLYIDEGGRSGRFVDGAGEIRLRYTGMVVFDATGRELDACLAPSPEGVGITIDDASAVYPLTVDPFLTGPAWTAESDQDFGEFGYSVATAGDVNGDGYSDVLVGAPGYSNGEQSEGRAYVYFGGATGPSTSPTWIAEGDQQFASFGWSVATAGDVNHDGYSDVIVGARHYSNGQTTEGRAFLYLGSNSGLALVPAWTAESDQAGAEFGSSVAAAGDVNRDGYSDVIVGANRYDNGQSNEGRAFLYLGSVSGLSASPAWMAESDQANALFASCVASAGDVNGDGFDDVVVGALQYSSGSGLEGRAFLYMGSGSGLSATSAWTTSGAAFADFFGTSVACAGDVNGDGYSDVIVTALGYDNDQVNEGRAYLYVGSSSGLSTNAVWTVEGNQTNAVLHSGANAGDVNGDGYCDVIVAATYDNGQTSEGQAFVYLGYAGGLSTAAVWMAGSDQDFASHDGFSVATAGDVNGDGHSDVIFGAPAYDNGETSEGRAFLYLGSAGAGPSNDVAWTAESDQTGGLLGLSLASAGDVNGDGYSDVIVGAFGYDNGQADEGRAYLYLGFGTRNGAGLSATPAWTAEGDLVGAEFGYSVAMAGDVNGDGYSDVLVGARSYSNGQASEGRAFLYLGSSSGLTLAPAWTTESNQAGASWGFCVASAGDVNGDGYGDIVVGAPLADLGQTDEGIAVFYAGSSTGLPLTPSWIAQSNQAGASFGYMVATAGDVNGDGYSDVIVGSPGYSNGSPFEGRAYLYQGTSSGLSVAAAWTGESNQANASFGKSIASAGDVNGDGYSDVVVGALGFANDDGAEGRAFVYMGSIAGLSPSAAWTAESNQADSYFGFSVATAGDLNGDGYSDIIVGASQYDNGETDEGRAFVYMGSATGLSPAPAWTAESNQANSLFGYCVASAGDVNGDGYSDVIVGASQYSSGQSAEGRAFLYHGALGRGGRVRGAQQRRLFGPEPIVTLGRSDAPGFRIQVKHLAIAGGGLAFLEWEIKPLGVAFDGLNLGRSATGQPITPFSTLTFDEVALPGHDHLTPCKWRARVAVEGNSFFPSTPWFSLPDNARSETDLRFPERYTRRR